jgi:1-acyl-sn-glycerol-3-phosphate acyltransferase
MSSKNRQSIRPPGRPEASRPFSVLYSIILIAVCAGITLSLIGVAAICSPFDSKGQIHQRLFRFWARTVLAISRVRVEVFEAAPLNAQLNYVVVSNHVSLVDAVILIAYLPVPIRFLAKEELFRIPIIGAYMRTTGHIPIRRGSSRSALRGLREASNVLRGSRMSLLVFPEGTRSDAGLRDFKDGAALLAIQSQLPVLPVGLIGTELVAAPRSFILSSGFVTLNIGAAIEPAAFPPIDRRQDLTSLLRTEVARLCCPTARL